MLAVKLTVPFACWRKAHARELLETERLPPPATCYGALLSFVGETDRDRHRGARISAGLIGQPTLNTVLRTLWRIKKLASPPGTGENAKPDYQQLLTGCHVMIWVDRGAESGERSLEERVAAAFQAPHEIDRFGGWSLGESTHLINDCWLVRDGVPPESCLAFIEDPSGTVTLPVWVDHVGTAGTRYVTGRLETLTRAPKPEELPVVG